MSSPKSVALVPMVILAFALCQGAAFAQGPLANGENHSGTISSPGQIHEWTFAASQNDAIFLSIGEVLGEVDQDSIRGFGCEGPTARTWVRNRVRWLRRSAWPHR